MSNRERHPPRLARALLRRILSAERYSEVVHDVDELFHDEVNTRGPVRAWAGYWREVLLVFGWTIIDRVRLSLDRTGARPDSAGADLSDLPASRDLWGDLHLDLAYAVRSLWKDRRFATTLILTFAVGIGASVAIATVVDATLLRSPPYDEPETLVSVVSFNERFGFDFPLVPVGHAQTWPSDVGFLNDVSLYQGRTVVRTDGPLPVTVAAQAVSAGLAQTLGVRTLFGRWFSDQDMEPGAAPVVVLSHAASSKWFGENRALNRVIHLNDIPHVVVGVMPPRFRFPRVGDSELWLPLSLDNVVAGVEVGRVRVIGRALPDLPMEVMNQRAARLSDGFGSVDAMYAGWGVRVRSYDGGRAESSIAQALWTLAAAAGLTWLIVIVNGVNLLSIRATARRKEMSVRRSLGASSPRLLRQLLTEVVVLALLAGVLATLLARATLTTMLTMLPEGMTDLSANPVLMDHRILWFAFVLSAATGLATGALPAFRLAAASAVASTLDLRRESPRGHMRIRSTLVVFEIGLSMALLVTAGLVINSFNRLVSVDPGIATDRLVFLAPDLPEHSYPDDEAISDFFARIVPRLQATPGVLGVALAERLPPNDVESFEVSGLMIDGREVIGADLGSLPFTEVDGDYFATMGIPLQAGRTFNSVDDDEANSVIVSEGLARLMWKEDDPIGRRFQMYEGEPVLTVVGVARDVRTMGLDDRRGSFEAYQPLTETKRNMKVAVRTASPAADMISPIRTTLRQVDPDLPLSGLTTATQELAHSVDGPRFLVRLMSVAAGVGLFLVVLGVYGILSFAVSQQSRDLSVRVALGAEISSLRWRVVGQGLRLVLPGIALGVAGALTFARVFESLLFGIAPTDPPTLAAVSVVMLATGMCACYFPARRATRVEPASVLKTH